MIKAIIIIYTKFCVTIQLYCMFYPQLISYRDSASEINCTVFVLFVVIARKRGVGSLRSYFVPKYKDPHQIGKTLNH